MLSAITPGHLAASPVFRRFLENFPGIPLSRAVNCHELVEKTLQLRPDELTYRLEVFRGGKEDSHQKRQFHSDSIDTVCAKRTL